MFVKKVYLLISLLVFSSTAYASGLKKYEHETPVETPDIVFFDEKNSPVSLNDFLGEVVVLNFWATWCRPCVAEMPSLDKLSKSFEGRSIRVIPLSIDYKGAEAVEGFYKENDINNLKVFNDSKSKSFKSFNLKALPTTVIINKGGAEVARVLGEIDWSESEVKDYLRGLSFE